MAILITEEFLTQFELLHVYDFNGGRFEYLANQMEYYLKDSGYDRLTANPIMDVYEKGRSLVTISIIHGFIMYQKKNTITTYTDSIRAGYISVEDFTNFLELVKS